MALFINSAARIRAAYTNIHVFQLERATMEKKSNTPCYIRGESFEPPLLKKSHRTGSPLTEKLHLRPRMLTKLLAANRLLSPGYSSILI